MGIDIKKILEILSTKRSIFHSEADFQFSLAWEIRAFYTNAKIRLEYPVVLFGKKAEIDIWVEIDNNIIPIELKYKTKSAAIESNGELFQLKNHSADDLGRLHYLKDIERIENLKNRHIGYAIFLTNASSYWSVPKKQKLTRDASFRIHEGRNLSGKLIWGTEKKPYPANDITLSGSYSIRWKDYSLFTENENGRFQYLIQEI